MPGTRTDVGQMFDHNLRIYKGDAEGVLCRLDKALPIAAGQTNKVFAGCVMYVNDSNQFVLGTRQSNNGTHCYVPHFAMRNQDDFDVNPMLGNTAGGVMTAVSATGALELESTEYDTNQTYTVGRYLTAGDGTGLAGDGQLTVATLGTHVIAGVISEVGPESDGSFTNHQGIHVIRFYTYLFPDHIIAS